MASVASLAFESQFRLSDSVAQLLDQIDCRAACSEEEREAISRLRYQANLREGAIGSSLFTIVSSNNKIPYLFRFTIYRKYKSFITSKIVRALMTC